MSADFTTHLVGFGGIGMPGEICALQAITKNEKHLMNINM